jgi:CheY-like chemotaxis protein
VDDLIGSWMFLVDCWFAKSEGIIWKNVLYAKNGVEAVEMSSNNPDIDLILMNIQMPRMNGYEAISKIRYFNKDVIIIIHTETAFEYVEKRAKEVGYTDYIRQPFETAILHDLLNKYFIS